ncbi:MAG: hypothetical protein QOG53_3065 [Frankiales bacterium]|nr:hypothetical protein [Frankiales bacterium]
MTAQADTPRLPVADSPRALPVADAPRALPVAERSPLRALVRASRRDLALACTVVVWVGVVLPLDNAGTGRQLWLGAVTAGLLIALLWRENGTTRAQVIVVVAFATAIEYTFSSGLGVYTYRLHQVPVYVPPGHGLVYLAALALGRSPLLIAGRRWVIPGTITVAGSYAAWGLFVSSRPDLLGFLWFCCLALWMRRSPAPLVFVGAFFVVTYLELLGTALGTWTWSLHDPTGLVAIGNPPSGAAGGYGFFDAAALFAAPWITARVRSVRRARRSAAGRSLQ